MYMPAYHRIKTRLNLCSVLLMTKADRVHQIGYALNSYYVYPTDGLLQENDFTKDGRW